MFRARIQSKMLGKAMVVVAQVPRGTGVDRLTTAPTPRPTGIDRLRDLSAQGSMLATIAALTHRRLPRRQAPCGAPPLPGPRQGFRRSRSAGTTWAPPTLQI